MKRGIRILLWSDAWLNLALGMLGPIYAIFVEEIGGDILDASWAYFAFMMTTALTIYIMGHVEDKIKNREKLIIAGYSLSAVGTFGYIFVYNQFSLTIVQIILGLASAILIPAFDSIYSKYLDKKHIASEWGNWEAMQYFFPAMAAVIGGYIASIMGFRVLFVVMFIISLLSIVFSTKLLKGKKYLNSRT